jgi:hypothetical protein
MLVAKRDPFELKAHDRPVPHAGAAPTSSRFTRTLNMLQMLGALIAVPVGIGSAYSMYQANFSAEATCKSLRVNIVRMLDKNVDAGTRHMLVKRDVEAFENTCGTVDPDATAAFKALLTAEKATAPTTTASVPRVEPQAQAVARKAEPVPAVKPKQPAARAPAVVTEAPPVQHDTLVSDAAWLAAVRSALVNHERDRVPAATAATAAPTSPAAPPRMLGELHTQPTVSNALAAPALPLAASVAALPTPQLDPDHPVPPAEIPEAAPLDAARTPSRFGALVAQIPFVGQSLADRVSR